MDIHLSNIITWIISLLALTIASYSLFLQRKDRKPRLQIRLDHSSSGSPDGSVHTYEITLANPTDKTIKVASIEFEPIGSKRQFSVSTDDISIAVPSHESRMLTLDERIFRVSLKNSLRAARGQTGRLVVTDELDNEHKSDWMNIKNLLLETF